ncbi:MAG TPA: tRNA pseudouridine(38-40) synthase TruA [Mycoplasmatales bacterium]|jgi:tRNA pseudouridine38-40 synthase|nr:tRNA pseudouridine(38-40) synthase TruA [Mycoplasmatales bacterium]
MYLVSISYDGSYFNGWAKQPNLFTVQGFIENKLRYIFSLKENFYIFAASRTDKGVHAIDQKFIFSLQFININSIRMKFILDRMLKEYVSVNEVWIVDDSFKLIDNIEFKEYRYLIKKEDNIFQRKYFFNCNFDINLQKLKNVLKNFEGTHDFFNFSYIRAKHKHLKDTIRKLDKVDVYESNDIICITFLAKGFLRYQIRAIIGECLDKHMNYNAESILNDMLSCKMSESKYKKIAPASGLYLWRIEMINEFKEFDF